MQHQWEGLVEDNWCQVSYWCPILVTAPLSRAQVCQISIYVPFYLLLTSHCQTKPGFCLAVISPATSSIAKELLQTGKNSADPQSSQSAAVVSPKDQLLYLAQLLDFKVQFSDFPKVSLPIFQ